jgi:hypothetical protein
VSSIKSELTDEDGPLYVCPECAHEAVRNNTVLYLSAITIGELRRGLAATALMHDLAVVTRNVAHYDHGRSPAESVSRIGLTGRRRRRLSRVPE